MTPVGARIGAMLGGIDGKVMFLGYGIYVGYRPCPTMDGEDNPKLVLDDGSVAWGCECWWGSEEKIRERLGDKEIILCEIVRDNKGAYVNSKRKNEHDGKSA